ERDRLGLEPGLPAALQPLLDHLEDALGRGIVSARLGEERLARLIEEELPAERRLRERRLLQRRGTLELGALRRRAGRGRALAGEPERALARDVDQDRLGHHLVDEAHLLGALRVDLLA